MKLSFAFVTSLLGGVGAWVVNPQLGKRRLSTHLDMAAVGIFYGTSTGSTQEVAEKIYQAFGPTVAAEPVDVDTLDPEGSALGKAFGQHDALVVGTPTWNTGADTARSGTGWDQLYYGVALHQHILEDKKIAVFGLGDQVSYSENFADATGELYDAFQSIGCKVMGAWSQEGYEHEESKSVRDDLFCGLILDMVNQEELTDERVQKWVAQLINEGFIGEGVTAREVNGGTATETAAHTPVAAPAAQEEFKNDLENLSDLLDESIDSHSSGGFTPHHNEAKGKTMWVSSDGRSSFVTSTGGPADSSAAPRFAP